MTGRTQTAFQTARRWVDRIERFGLSVLVAGMVGLAALQILMRNVWQSGWSWAGDLLGMGLLWLTMLGALAATGLARHLSIDLAAALLPRRWAGPLGRVTSLFAAVICVLLALAAGRYVGLQRELDITRLLGAPAWKYYLVIPVVFWIMAARFLVRVLIPSAWFADNALEGLPGEGRTGS
ncbi:MAG: TRAP transporter small permease [Kiritimatiellae bacterium]|nr:TRAP transporter small permease [Kiritimatiellia bacterium]